MPRKAADELIETLIDWNIEIVFGLAGDGVNGIVEALRMRQDKIRFIQVRHEEAAAFMACAYAKWTGRIGVCLATTGPGGVHLPAWSALLYLMPNAYGDGIPQYGGPLVFYLAVMGYVGTLVSSIWRKTISLLSGDQK